jgi:hypothetical protein
MVVDMNFKTLLGCCGIVATFGLFGACGGSDEGDDSTTGGKGGTDSGTGGSTGGSAGSSTGGSTGGTAGSSTGGASGGTAGAGTGGATGGTAGAATGGTAGAGTGGASATCPTDAPQGGSDCTDSGLWCTFPGAQGTQQCACFDGEWDCDPCPTDEPQSNDPCNSGPGGGSQCTYGANQCVCGGGDWDCAECPATAPADNDDCTLNNQQCAYAGSECTCQGFGTDLQWNCETPGGPGPTGCPPNAPAPGSACTGSPLTECDYGGGNSCYCIAQQWFCN